MTEDSADSGRRPRFSQRYGHTPFSTVVQTDSLDERTRTDLWNLLVIPRFIDARLPGVDAEVVWAHHLGFQRDRYGDMAYRHEIHAVIFDRIWYEVMDLLEFLVGSTPEYRGQGEIVELTNAVFALNRVGYRVVESQIVPITDEIEIASVQAAASTPLSNASRHIRRALELFSERDSPNFAKVIQEAMSGAEAAAQALSGRGGATLGDALSGLNKQGHWHPALLEGWKRIYGFTSDEGGIRHALKDGSVDPGQDLAQYFLVTCSAFVNLATATASR